MAKIETVKDLVEELLKFKLDAKVCIGGSFDNRVSIGWGWSEGATKETCEYVCLDIAGMEEEEK